MDIQQWKTYGTINGIHQWKMYVIHQCITWMEDKWNKNGISIDGGFLLHRWKIHQNMEKNLEKLNIFQD